MPLYIYRCVCGHEIEELQKVGEAPPTTCEDCPQKNKTCSFEKQSTTASVRFSPSEGFGGWESTGNGSPLLMRKHKGKSKENQ